MIWVFLEKQAGDWKSKDIRRSFSEKQPKGYSHFWLWGREIAPDFLTPALSLPLSMDKPFSERLKRVCITSYVQRACSLTSALNDVQSVTRAIAIIIKRPKCRRLLNTFLKPKTSVSLQYAEVKTYPGVVPGVSNHSLITLGSKTMWVV